MIEIANLTRRYGATGITDVSLSCEPGTVTGFLGPNGAGKSTTMRILCGLERADSGLATIDGMPYARLPQPGRRIGVLLDPTAQHPGRSGRETLTLAARTMGVGPDRVQDMLRLVDLDKAAAGKRVGKYSLGMRQRLALAQALLGDPGILVLDEPANGLDPQGIHWMRVLLRDFAGRGGTVLLSSHLLHEVEAVADRLVIIGGGRIRAAGRPADLLSGGGTLVRALDNDELSQALRRSGFAVQVTANGLLTVDADAETVGRLASSRQVVLTELRPREQDGLEQLFLSLTSTASPAADDRTEVAA